jgi:hypothetical protein
MCYAVLLVLQAAPGVRMTFDPASDARACTCNATGELTYVSPTLLIVSQAAAGDAAAAADVAATAAQLHAATLLTAAFARHVPWYPTHVLAHPMPLTCLHHL